MSQATIVASMSQAAIAWRACHSWRGHPQPPACVVSAPLRPPFAASSLPRRHYYPPPAAPSLRPSTSSRPRRTLARAAEDAIRGAESEPKKLTVRINKCFRHLASRREADRFVLEGRVRVDGVVAEVGQRVAAGALVTLDGRPVEWERLNLLDDGSDIHASADQGGVVGRGAGVVAGEERFVYLKYWKPAGVVCTTDVRKPNNVISELGHPERIFPVGRLDKETTGLLLLTSDGRVPNAVGRAGGRHPKTYWVRTEREVTEEEMERLRRGVVITTTSQRERGGKRLTARTLECEVRRRPGGTANEIQMSIREGRNRQIRRMLAAVEHEVVALHRVGVMSITLTGLRPGEWCELDGAEMDALREAIHAGDTGPSVMQGLEELTEEELREAELSLRAASPAQWAERAAYERSQSKGKGG